MNGISVRRSGVVALLVCVVALLPPVPAFGQPKDTTGLVADAGDSAFSGGTRYVTLLGAAYGGRAPYRFSWSSEQGSVIHRSGPTALVDVTGVGDGTYEARLEITDATGAVATDSVAFVVADQLELETVLLDSTLPDETAGVGGGEVGLPGLEFPPFDVAPDVSSLRIELTWEATNDYDLSVFDPDGEWATGSYQSEQPEVAVVPQPRPGRWRVVAERWVTTSDPGVHARVVASSGADARPAVDAGGPYRFIDGDVQRLAGRVSGGSGAVIAGWDTDLDGRTDVRGADARVQLPAGRHLVVLRARDANGLERQQMTSVLVGSAERVREEAVPLTVIGITDTGINPYHREFSAATYPDPEVLEITRNFTRHPSEYIPGYPESSRALPISLNDGYFPIADEPLWTPDAIGPGTLHWIPGTKIVGAIDSGFTTGADKAPDVHPLLDDDGHGSGSASIAAGNRYGYCPTCLLVVVEGLDPAVVAQLGWVDISSNSYQVIGGVPTGLAFGAVLGKASAERGQTTLFASGNGTANAFDSPMSSYGSGLTGPDWNVTVGAIRQETGGAIVGDGTPAHLSSFGTGYLPCASRVGATSQCSFGGTSAATPYTAGVFGATLTGVRSALGDHSRAGQLPGQVVARGTPVPGSVHLADGELTRRELRAAVLKTATPLGREIDPQRLLYPASYTGDEGRWAVEGYGAATPNSATRAVAVLLGEAAMPRRDGEDAFFAEDCEARDGLYGSFDRDGDGEADDCSKSESVDAVFWGDGAVTTDPAPPGADAYGPSRPSVAQPDSDAGPIRYWLHRVNDQEPDVAADQGCALPFNALFMDRTDSAGDEDACFQNQARVSTSHAIYAGADVLGSPLPAGSTVAVELYLTTLEPDLVTVQGTLVASHRAVGSGSATVPVRGGGAEGCAAVPDCWSAVSFAFRTDRPVAPGEQLTFRIRHDALRYAVGYEGAHASSITITPGLLPRTGLEFGVTVDEVDRKGAVTGRVAFPALGPDPQGAGFHPVTEVVQVAVDDPDFTRPVYARVDRASGSYRAEVGRAVRGAHRVYVRALRDRYPSPVVTARA